MSREVVRTHFAIQAQEFAQTFNSILGHFLMLPANYRPEMVSPDGPSTGGGTQALQHLRLVPQAAGFATLVFGWVNQKDGTAELRTYENLQRTHEERFKRPLALDRDQYNRFLSVTEQVLSNANLRVAVAGPENALRVSVSPPPAPQRTAIFALLGFIAFCLLALAAIAVFWAMRAP